MYVSILETEQAIQVVPIPFQLPLHNFIINKLTAEKHDTP